MNDDCHQTDCEEKAQGSLFEAQSVNKANYPVIPESWKESVYKAQQKEVDRI